MEKIELKEQSFLLEGDLCAFEFIYGRLLRESIVLLGPYVGSVT